MSYEDKRAGRFARIDAQNLTEQDPVNASLAKSPTRRIRTQSNHFFMAIYAAARLESLRVKQRLNHFALRSRLYLKAIRYAFRELQILKTA